jgi:3-oxoacyl-(acyl-carrier-protein) synthase
MACASGTAAIGMGLDWIRGGSCDAVVAGGVDALSSFVYAGFACLKALDPEGPRPFDRHRAGLGLGEGIGLVLLQREEEPAPGGAAALPCRVEVAGRGSSADAVHLTGPDASGSGVVRAMEHCLRDASLLPSDVDFINAHGTGTVYNDLMESKAIFKLFGERARVLAVHSIKGAIGHTMAAAGGIEAAVCAEILRRGLVPATTQLTELDPAMLGLDVVQGMARRGDFRCGLSTSSGFGGVNAALVFRGPTPLG